MNFARAKMLVPKNSDPQGSLPPGEAEVQIGGACGEGLEQSRVLSGSPGMSFGTPSSQALAIKSWSRVF